jgi:hypothetical protein
MDAQNSCQPSCTFQPNSYLEVSESALAQCVSFAREHIPRSWRCPSTATSSTPVRPRGAMVQVSTRRGLSSLKMYITFVVIQAVEPHIRLHTESRHQQCFSKTARYSTSGFSPHSFLKYLQRLMFSPFQPSIASQARQASYMPLTSLPQQTRSARRRQKAPRLSGWKASPQMQVVRVCSLSHICGAYEC